MSSCDTAYRPDLPFPGAFFSLLFSLGIRIVDSRDYAENFQGGAWWAEALSFVFERIMAAKCSQE
jgi:hypothetical protein